MLFALVLLATVPMGAEFWALAAHKIDIFQYMKLHFLVAVLVYKHTQTT